MSARANTGTEQGKTWQSEALPDELADSVMDVVGNRIWVATPKAVWYRDVLSSVRAPLVP